MFISIVIPAYNEEKVIKQTLLDIYSFIISRSPDTFEVLVVDDGSQDKTAELVKEEILHNPNLRLISLGHKGKGSAVKSGMLDARGQAVLFMDADGSTSITELNNFLPFLDQGFDVVVGSRVVEGAKIEKHQGFLRETSGKVFRFFVHLILPLQIKDTQNGFKLFSKKAASEIFKRQTINGWAFDLEIISIAHLLGFKIKEVPIKWINRPESKMNLSGIIKTIFEAIKIRKKLWFKEYR